MTDNRDYKIVAVKVSPYLQMTQHGLMLAVQKMPMETRKRFRSFALLDEAESTEGERLFLIKAVNK